MDVLEMTTLAIDPGVTTAFALLNAAGDVLRAEELGNADLGILREVLNDNPDAEVLVEKGPTREVHNRPYVEEAERVVEESGKAIQWISPSQWKNSPTNRRPVPRGSKHIADAVRMARWHQRFRRNREEGQTQRDASRTHQDA